MNEPQWTAPFHAPQFTDEEFEVQKAKYVAEHGYKIAIPGLSDIFHFGTPAPMTKLDELLWKDKDYDILGPERTEEIRKMKAKKKERYIAMLASPTPNIVRNAGSIMTALDDAQDAISTLAMIGRIAVRFAPRLLARAFLGPVGWLLLANDILNLVISIGQMATLPTRPKPVYENCTSNNPWSKKAKLSRAKKLFKAVPTKGDIIQALQTTDQVFGFGISLGPIVGMVQDLFFGAVGAVIGEKVSFSGPLPDATRTTIAALKPMKSTSFALAHEFETDEMMLLELFLASYLSHQQIMPIQQAWNPLERVEGVAFATVPVPMPTNILTLEVIEEVKGPDPKDAIWPEIDKPRGNVVDISDVVHPIAADNLKRFVERNNHNWLGYSAGILASETAMYALANLEGEEDVRYGYTATAKAALNLVDEGYYPDPEQPRGKLNTFVKFLEDAEKYALPTSKAAVLEFCRENEIKLLEIPMTL